MIAFSKSASHPATTLRESPPNLSGGIPGAEKPRGELVALTCMLIACAAFAGSFVFWVLIPAVKSLMGT